MYAFHSSPSRSGLHAMVIGAFAVAAILFGLSRYETIPYPVVFQTAAVICLVAALYLTARYSLRVYRYAIEPNGITDAYGTEQCDLVITEIVGKKQKVVARIALRDIGEVVAVKRDDKETLATIKNGFVRGKQVFTYANVPILPEACYIEAPEEGAVIVIPTDEGMLKILKGNRL